MTGSQRQTYTQETALIFMTVARCMQFLQRELLHPALLEASFSIYSLQSFLFNLNTLSLE